MGHILRTVMVPLVAALAATTAAAAQPARDARLSVTVVDPSGGVIPNATVTAAGVDAAARAAAIRPAITGANGVATFEPLVQGRYTIEAEFDGFETGVLQDVRLRRGDNRHVVMLTVKNVREAVTVAEDAQAAAADPRGNAFRTRLTPDEIAALSDDPTELAQQLQDMAGGNAVIRVDSFAGAPLPPKALIKSIHIVRDAFAAENHSAEFDEINVITQPGSGPLRGSVTSRVRDAALNARSPFTPTRGAEHSQGYQALVGGTIVKNKSSFSLSVEGRNGFDTPIVNVALPGGRRSETLDIHRRSDNWTLYGLVDYALTRDQTLRLSYEHSNSTRDNLGLGGFDYLPERAYQTSTADHELRAQAIGPLGRRTFANSRVELSWLDTASQSAVEAPTLRIFDSATSGGAQVRGGRHPRNLEVASDVDYVRGRHTVRTGVLLDGGRYRSDDATNYLGTYTFTSLDAFRAGRPALYTRRTGDPLVEYWNLQAGVYLQDDFRVRKNLTLSPGVRYEIQTHLHDRGNVGPRFGVTWAPFKSGRTTLRGSVGTFYNWLNAITYEQTLRVDGFRQRELNIVNPAYPDAGGTGTITTANRYRLGDGVEMARTFRASAGIDRTFTAKLRANASYSRVSGADVLRGRNLNAPVNGVRPDAGFANDIAVVSDARLVSHQLGTTLAVNLAGGLRNADARRWNWRRSTLRLAYWLAKAEGNSDGPFSVPASGRLDTEWGPTPGDRRQRVTASLNTQALKNLNANLTLAATTGAPYTITTGLDDNGDAIFNDRPAGVARNSVRTPGQSTLSANLSYLVGLGTPRVAAARQERGDGPRAGPAAGRYVIVFTASALNLTNRANYGGFSGVMTSPFFRSATFVTNPRRIELGASLRF